MDWLAELQTDGVSALRNALSTVAATDDDDEVDADDGMRAIAAAEVVAAALGQGRDRLTKEGVSWVDANAGALFAEDVTMAKRAVERLLEGTSELRDLWEDDGPDTEWHADLRVLIDRLTQAAKTAQPGAQGAYPTATTPPGPRLDTDKQVLLTFLQARGLQPTREQMARINAVRDPAEIARWMKRALAAPSVAAILDD